MKRFFEFFKLRRRSRWMPPEWTVFPLMKDRFSAHVSAGRWELQFAFKPLRGMGGIIDTR